MTAIINNKSACRILLTGLLLSSESWAAAAAPLTPPVDARPMTGVELYMLYRDKSWKWDDGAGRLDDQGRVFTAWSGSGESEFRARGRWIVTDKGQLCLKADWHTPTGTYPDKTCFSHRIVDRTIYQKKEPSGDWYVFRHAVPSEGDEFRKLVREDLVSSRLARRETSPQTKPSPEKAPLVTQTLDGAARSGEGR